MDVKKIFGRQKRPGNKNGKPILRRLRKKDKKPVLLLISPSGQVVRA